LKVFSEKLSFSPLEDEPKRGGGKKPLGKNKPEFFQKAQCRFERRKGGKKEAKEGLALIRTEVRG